MEEEETVLPIPGKGECRLTAARVEKNSHKSASPLALFNLDRSSCRYLDGHSVRKDVEKKIRENSLDCFATRSN